MEATSHVDDDPMKVKVKRIVVTKFEHKGEQYGCGDYAEGFFTRHHGGFVFEIYFDAEPSEDTYGNTRMSEIYINSEDGTPQWTWHAMNREPPDWDYGLLLMSDLLAGIDAAVKDRVSNNMEYCIARVNCLVDQLLHTGVERTIVVTSMTEGVKRAQGES
jgi:hypothetical protein